MPYRPRGAPASATGNGTHRRPSYAARLAIARGHKRRRAVPHGSAGAGVLAVILLLGVVAITSAAGLVTVGAAGAVTITALDQGLPDVRAFRDLRFSQPTRILDRDGKTELARFYEERRKVVTFEEIPPFVLDATTAVEDDTFWENPGFDLEATVNALAQSAAGGSDRGGASTITQQLVRARLLPAEVTEQDNTREGLYVRKAKELIQAFKLTQAFPGEDGKKDIITAYLNEIFYGQNAYGIAAAANVYFGKELSELTVAEAALLAGVPQAPSLLDPYKYAKREKVGPKGKGKRKTRLVVPTCGSEPEPTCKESAPISRRNFILQRLVDGKGRWTTLNTEELKAALDEPVVLKPPKALHWQAPHFVNALIPELQTILADRESIQRGGYTVISTLDMRGQRLGERVIQAGAVLPNLPASKYFQQINRLKLRRDAGWIGHLRGSNLRNGALVAQDYRTGDILVYVGSAGYYRKKTPRFAPKVDHIGASHRQPGSAWKPIIYATGIDTERLTAGSYLLDRREQFGPGWTPKNADGVYRGNIRVRDAIQQSLNIPAIRALQKVGIPTVRRYAVKAGFTFLGGNNRMLDQAGLAGALGTVEVRPLDMTAAFGAFGNGGKVTKPRYILKVLGPDGEVIYEAGDPITEQVWKPATAYIMADILDGNTNKSVNPAWGAVFEMHNTRDGSRREAAVKTGTTNELKDYSTFGILPMPKNKNQPALAVGVWYGNSDSSSPNLGLLRYSLDNAGRTWAAFVRDYMNNKPAPGFTRPKGVIAGPGGELYVQGTQPGGARQVDSAAPPTSSTPDRSDSNDSGDNDSDGTTKPRRGGGGGGGGGGDDGPAPAPTCRPGSTNKPPGCVIPGPD
jgi:membrane peptidoglycan carboxypeptidase